MTELEVAWSPALETARPRAQQRRPEPEIRITRNANDIVLGFLEDNPDTSMRAIQEATGLSMQHVNSALYQLLKRGHVTRSHRQQDDRSKPVLWRICR